MKNVIYADHAMPGGGCCLEQEVGRSSFSLQSLLISLSERLDRWHMRARQRHELMGLSDHMLKDIGISRADAVREAERPFWDGEERQR